MCCSRDQAVQWRARVGSSNSLSGGVVHDISNIIIHPHFVSGFRHLDNDLAIIRVLSEFSYNDNVRPGRLAGVNYYVRENDDVWIIGWGRTAVSGFDFVIYVTIDQNLYRISDLFFKYFMLKIGQMNKTIIMG